MSKPLKSFGQALLKGDTYKKFFRNHTPGKRIWPSQSGDNDAKLQLRVDAGEIMPNGMRRVYLQVNSEAKNEKLKEFKGKKRGTHANLASTEIDPDTPINQQKAALAKAWEELEDEGIDNLP